MMDGPQDFPSAAAKNAVIFIQSDKPSWGIQLSVVRQVE